MLIWIYIENQIERRRTKIYLSMKCHSFIYVYTNGNLGIIFSNKCKSSTCQRSKYLNHSICQKNLRFDKQRDGQENRASQDQFTIVASFKYFFLWSVYQSHQYQGQFYGDSEFFIVTLKSTFVTWQIESIYICTYIIEVLTWARHTDHNIVYLNSTSKHILRPKTKHDWIY